MQVSSDEGNIVDLVRKGKMPLNKSAIDQNRLANGVVKYSLHLNPGEQTELFVVVPFYGKNTPDGKLSITNTADEFTKSS